MINIAICDDDKMTSHIENLILNQAGKESIKTNRSIYFDGFKLIESLKQGAQYDLIYLDIEMKSMNGIQVATYIREQDIPIIIVYISGYEKYLKELFTTEPFRFLSKPINEDDFNHVFMSAYQRICRKSEYFPFSYNKTLKKVLLKNILYFESCDRLIIIHHSEGTDKFYGKLNNVEMQIMSSKGRFLRIHQSFLVNFDFIKIMSFTNVELTNGLLLQISTERQKSIRTQFCSIAGYEVSGNE